MFIKTKMIFHMCIILATFSLTLGEAPPINFCRATMSGFGNDGLYDDPEAKASTRVDFTINTPNYPSLYQNESCVCTLTTTEDQNRFSINFKFDSYERKIRECPSLLYVKINDDNYYVCAGPGRADGITTHFKLKSGDVIKLYLVNEHNNLVRSSVHVSGVIGEYTFLKCKKERVTHDDCDCTRDPPAYYISRPPESSRTRVLIGFMALLGFLILLGVAVGVWYYLRRRKKQKEEKETSGEAVRSEPEKIARNSAFFTDPDLPKNAHGIYAEIDFGAGLPFSPDPNLRLEMRGDESETGIKYNRGSVDSGLYSEMGEKTNGNGMTPYATSYDMIQTFGPDHRHEPPALQSSPKLAPKSAEELEQLYAKPQKRNKRKKKKNGTERQQSEVIYQHPPLPDKSSPFPVPKPPQMQPVVNPYPGVNFGYTGSQSGSTSSAIFTGQADLGQGVLQSSRSSLNELYVTDSRSTVNLNGSKGTMETDI